MNILKKYFLFNKKSDKNKEFSPGFVDQSLEIAKLVKEARIQQKLTINFNPALATGMRSELRFSESLNKIFNKLSTFSI